MFYQQYQINVVDQLQIIKQPGRVSWPIPKIKKSHFFSELMSLKYNTTMSQNLISATNCWKKVMSKAHTSAVRGTAKLQGLTAESRTAEELLFLQIRPTVPQRGGNDTKPRLCNIRIPKRSGKLLLHGFLRYYIVYRYRAQKSPGSANFEANLGNIDSIDPALQRMA